MSRRKVGFWIVLIGVLVIAVAVGPDLWAAPGQSTVRQTVPTRTPTPSKPRPTEQPTPTPTAVMEATPTPLPAPLLPSSGGRSIHLGLGIAMIIVGLVALTVAKRRV